MRFLLSFLFGCLLTMLNAQKHDYLYLEKDPGSGSGVSIYYNELTDEMESSLFDWDGTTFMSPIFCDAEGDFLGYSNSSHIYDSIGRHAINGDSIAVGFYQNLIFEELGYDHGVGIGQNAAFIPITDSLFYYFHKSSEVLYGSPGWAIDIEEMGQQLTAYSHDLYLTEVHLTPEGRLYLPPDKKKQKLIEDLLVFEEMNFIKHADGKDWFIHIPQVLTDDAYLLKLHTDGQIENLGLQYYSEHNGRVRSKSSNAISEDGTKMGRLIVRSDTDFMHILELFNFNRCTGQTERFFIDSFPLSNLFTAAGDIEFSKNGRFVYTATGAEIQQFDLENPNFFADRDTIGKWNGETYNSTPIIFDFMWRLPSGKIVVNSFAASPYLHYIHNPNELGEDCNFEIQAHMFPLDPLIPPHHANISGLPAFPPYRMQALNIDCSTSTATGERERQKDIILYPNPTNAMLYVNNAEGKTIRLIDALGRHIETIAASTEQVRHIDVSFLHRGVYYLFFEGGQSRKFVKW